MTDEKTIQFSEKSAFNGSYPTISEAPPGEGIILSHRGFRIQLLPTGLFLLDGVIVNPGDEQRGELLYESFVRLLKGEDFDAHLRVKELEAECQRLRDAISEITPPPVQGWSERDELVSKIITWEVDIKDNRDLLRTMSKTQREALLDFEHEIEADEAALGLLKEELKRLDEET